jgi:hypothetical protein
MLGLVMALLLVCLGAAVAGAVVPGLFWLTLVALAGLLVTGAAGVSMIRPPAEGGAPPVERRAHLRVVSSAGGGRDRGGSQDGGELRSAA